MQVILKNMSLRKNDLERKVMYMEQSLIKYTKDELTEVFSVADCFSNINCSIDFSSIELPINVL